MVILRCVLPQWDLRFPSYKCFKKYIFHYILTHTKVNCTLAHAKIYKRPKKGTHSRFFMKLRRDLENVFRLFVIWFHCQRTQDVMSYILVHTKFTTDSYFSAQKAKSRDCFFPTEFWLRHSDGMVNGNTKFTYHHSPPVTPTFGFTYLPTNLHQLTDLFHFR